MEERKVGDRRVRRSWFRTSGLAVAIMAGILTIVCVPGAARAQVAFHDTTFNEGDWTTEVFFRSGQGGSATAVQSLVGGNPGAHRLVTHTIGTRPAQVFVVHERAGATYDPSTQGAIAAIDYSFDARTFSDPGYGGQSATLAIRQGGVVYCGPFFANGEFIWRSTAQSGLVASNFTVLNGAAHPDFSSTGDPLHFGLVTSNTNPEGGIIGQSTTIVGYDNWSVGVAATTGIGSWSDPVTLEPAASPNPLHDGAVIRFALENAGRVHLSIFDARGGRVREFDLLILSPGPHSVRWDARDSGGRGVAAGTYFYRIDAGDRVARGRMTLLP